MVAIPSMGEPFFRDLQRRTAEIRGSANGIFDYGFEPDAGHRAYFVTRPVVLWLERKLDFPNWSEAEIQAMPQTHIGAWTKEGGIPIHPLYATEAHTAGTRALGVNIPILSREQLSVFSPAQWEESKSSLIIDHWERAIRRQMAGNPSSQPND